jgi:glutathione S-transferase
MSNLILHHYPLSPFAMKVRAMLGYAQLSWQSCRTAAMPPRAHLSALAGGYRRIPVAQDGADVYCDSKVIAEEIAQRSGLNALALDHCDDAVREYVQTVDFDVFFACIHCAQAAGLAQTLRRELSLLGILRVSVCSIISPTSSSVWPQATSCSVQNRTTPTSRPTTASGS